MAPSNLIQAMKENPSLKNFPVIVLSANDSPQIIARCLEIGACDFLVKPVRIQECKALKLKM